MADMYTASLVPVVAAPSDVPGWAALGVWEVSWSVMGVRGLFLAITDDFGSLVPAPSAALADPLFFLH